MIEFEKGTIADLPKKETLEISDNELEGKKILIVDDNELNRLVATAIVEVYGATTLEASNGQEAVELLSSGKPDIILMDIQMPVMNGYDASIQIRNSGDKVPIIALTANAIKGENEKCIAAGMNDYIAKPFKEEEFLKIIAKWLGRHIETKTIDAALPSTAELYSLSKLEEISRGNKEFVKRMVKLFLEQVPVATEEIVYAYQHHELDKVKAIAHRIKPTIDNMEIHSLRNEIREIETLASKKKRSDRLENLIQLLQDVIGKVVADLSRGQF